MQCAPQLHFVTIHFCRHYQGKTAWTWCSLERGWQQVCRLGRPLRQADGGQGSVVVGHRVNRVRGLLHIRRQLRQAPALAAHSVSVSWPARGSCSSLMESCAGGMSLGLGGDPRSATLHCSGSSSSCMAQQGAGSAGQRPCGGVHRDASANTTQRFTVSTTNAPLDGQQLLQVDALRAQPARLGGPVHRVHDVLQHAVRQHRQPLRLPCRGRIKER